MVTDLQLAVHKSTVPTDQGVRGNSFGNIAFDTAPNPRGARPDASSSHASHGGTWEIRMLVST